VNIFAERAKKAARLMLKETRNERLEMKITLNPSIGNASQAGFSLVEAAVGMGIMGTVVGALLSGFGTGMFTMQLARENLRATQIMLERMETIRLYSWDQINTPGFVSTNFTASYDPQSTNSGVVYSGTLSISNAPVTSSYSNDMKMFTVTLNWKTGSLPRTRQFTTYISRYGLQDYIY
jgi:type II secretory pathway pseudopilin PulG